MAIYGASKAFLNHFSEALQQEEEANGIRVQSLCPGFTRSEFHGRDSMVGFPHDQIPQEMWMESPEVVAESLAALDGGPVVLVSGAANRKLAQKSLAAQRERMPD